MRERCGEESQNGTPLKEELPEAHVQCCCKSKKYALNKEGAVLLLLYAGVIKSKCLFAVQKGS